jgi:hypothetical protein
MIAEIEALVSAFESGALSRRDFLQGVVLAAASPRDAKELRAVSLNHVSLAVSDVDASQAFHERILGVEDFDLEGHADELRGHGVEPFIRQDRPELYFSDPDGVLVQLSGADYRG